MSDRLSAWLKNHADSATPLIPAATVILARDGDRGLETLLLKRSQTLSFADGSWVFPGGKIDPSDRPANSTDDLEAARIAAARECREEADLTVAPEDLVYFSHWIPPRVAPKRFSTWFFLAAAPPSAVQVDQGEIIDHTWLTPTAALQRAESGELELLPPTWVSLHDLREFSDVETALAATAERGPQGFATRIVDTPEGPAALWEEDAGYRTGSHDQKGGRHRLTMAKGQWRLDRSFTS